VQRLRTIESVAIYELLAGDTFCGRESSVDQYGHAARPGVREIMLLGCDERRRTSHPVRAVLFAATGLPTLAAAQASTPVRDLSPPVRSERNFGSILNVRQVARGAVLVNDPIRRQLILLDERLKTKRVVLDSVTVGPHAYGPIGSFQRRRRNQRPESSFTTS
jgi:hypothetical protein